MKNSLRKEIVKKREELDEDFRKEYSQDLTDMFLNSETYKTAKVIMSYVSFRGEFDTSIINKQIIEDKKTLLLPKTYEEGVMKAFEIRDLNKLKKNDFGIFEPLETNEKEPDLIIVPGVAFDLEGHRLGFGAGYYDRFLGEKSIKTIAFCYDFQVLDVLPKDEHDIPVDEIFYMD